MESLMQCLGRLAFMKANDPLLKANIHHKAPEMCFYWNSCDVFNPASQMLVWWLVLYFCCSCIAFCSDVTGGYCWHVLAITTLLVISDKNRFHCCLLQKKKSCFPCSFSSNFQSHNNEKSDIECSTEVGPNVELSAPECSPAMRCLTAEPQERLDFAS